MPRYVSPVFNITDINGAPMVGAKLVFYETGTTTKKTIYSDSALTTPITNPVTAVSSDAGAIYPDIYIDGIYKVVQQDDSGTADTDDGAVLWTRDPVGDISPANGALWLNDLTYNVPNIVYASDDKYYISLTDGNQGNEPSASPTEWQEIPMKDMVGLTETQTLTNKTLTNPVIAQINDANGNEGLEIAATASAVNEPRVENSATGNAVKYTATGDDTDIEIEIAPKGSGDVVLSGLVRKTVTDAVTLSGTNQGDYNITTNVINVTTALVNEAATLPPAIAGYEVTIRNNSGNQIRIYPASGDSLNGAGVDTAEVMTAATLARTYVCMNGTNWITTNELP